MVFFTAVLIEAAFRGRESIEANMNESYRDFNARPVRSATKLGHELCSSTSTPLRGGVHPNEPDEGRETRPRLLRFCYVRGVEAVGTECARESKRRTNTPAWETVLPSLRIHRSEPREAMMEPPQTNVDRSSKEVAPRVTGEVGGKWVVKGGVGI
jgi:hypothetical protein